MWSDIRVDAVAPTYTYTYIYICTYYRHETKVNKHMRRCRCVADENLESGLPMI